MSTAKDQILFFYVEQSDNGFIRNRGFNFSANYYFSMKKDSDGTYRLTMDKVPAEQTIPDDFFAPAVNVTAVVGKNGTGKTTLLMELVENVNFVTANNPFLKNADSELRERYERKKYAIVMLESGKVVCYHNLTNIHVPDDSIEAVDYKQILQQASDQDNNRGFYGFSRIYFSQSMYSAVDNDYVVDSTNGYGFLDHILLTAPSMQVRAGDYYWDMCNRQFNEDYDRASQYFHNYLRVFSSSMNLNDFQQVLDVYYLKRWRGLKEKNPLLKWYSPALTINVRHIPKHFGEDSASQEDKDIYQIYKNAVDELTGILTPDSANSVIRRLLYNLYIEYRIFSCYDASMIQKERKLGSEKKLREYLASLKNVWVKACMDEIDELQDIIEDSENNSDYLTRDYVTFDMGYASNSYARVLEFLTDMWDAYDRGFMVRYLNISGLTFSSGERSILNMYTWIAMLADQLDFYGRSAHELKDNVLLVLDEADLYLHPEWQRNFINEIRKAIPNLFPKKNVQIIFSTHSPIMLSDVPRQCTVFLGDDEGTEHKQTFGNSIYSLYNDAFFLKDSGQMGEFAREKIDGLIDKLKPEETEEKREDGRKHIVRTYMPISDQDRKRYLNDIELIGEPLLKQGLMRMLNRHPTEAMI